MFRSKHTTGVINNLPESVYRADPALSTSLLKEIGNPQRFYAMAKGLLRKSDTDCMKLGRLFHMRILERERWDKEVVVCPDEHSDKRYKENRAWWAKAEADSSIVIREHELAMVTGMERQFYQLPIVKDISKPRTELSVFARDYRKGIDTKCRIDMECDGVVVDIKTTREGGADPIEFMRTCRKYKYAWQAQNYMGIAKAAGLNIREWYFAVVEKAAPYTCAIYSLDRDDLMAADAQLEEAYRMVQSCQELNTYPGYTPQEPKALSLSKGL